MFESAEAIVAAKVYILLGILIFIFLWKFWKDINLGQRINQQFIIIQKNQKDLEEEHKNLIDQIENLGRRTADLSAALHRLDQNTSRLADNVKGDQAMTRAIEMARKGNNHQQIMKATGLPNEEVEAIIHSHKNES